MKRDIERMLNVLTAAGVAAAALFALGRLAEVKLNPMRYAMQSAPWYVDVVVFGGAALLVALAAQIARFFWRRR